MGHQDGAANVAQFYAPAALTVDAQGNVYVADQGTNLIIKITPAGVATTIAGNGSANYINSTNALSAAFNAPRGIAVDAQGNIYVGDTGNNLIRKITAAGVVTTFAGGNTTSASTITLIDATGTDARFRQPRGLAFDSKGNLLVADYGNNSIRKIASDGTVSTYIGNSTISTLVGNPTALVLDGSDNVYIADEAGRVLKINSSLSVMNTIAGTSGSNGYQEGAGNTAQFNVPAGVAVVSGNVYVADYANSRIRKITGIQ
nr:hypothetical protein [Mucilaginibacter straminoryzae]